MRTVTLFIAMSLDGYIAGVDGNISWLEGQTEGANDMISYDEFIKDIDTVILGWNTYHQIATELSPEEWMYKDFKSYVLTQRDIPETKQITFVNKSVCELVKTLKQEEGKGIWICGGAKVIQPLMKEKIIDKFHISIIPIILGNGIRLFETIDRTIPLRLLKSVSYNGITDVIYVYR